MNDWGRELWLACALYALIKALCDVSHDMHMLSDSIHRTAQGQLNLWGAVVEILSFKEER